MVGRTFHGCDAERIHRPRRGIFWQLPPCNRNTSICQTNSAFATAIDLFKSTWSRSPHWVELRHRSVIVQSGQVGSRCGNLFDIVQACRHLKWERKSHNFKTAPADHGSIFLQRNGIAIAGRNFFNARNWNAIDLRIVGHGNLCSRRRTIGARKINLTAKFIGAQALAL